MWSRTQVFFSNYFTIANISPLSAIHSFMEEIQDQYNIIVKHRDPHKKRDFFLKKCRLSAICYTEISVKSIYKRERVKLY